MLCMSRLGRNPAVTGEGHRAVPDEGIFDRVSVSNTEWEWYRGSFGFRLSWILSAGDESLFVLSVCRSKIIFGGITYEIIVFHLRLS